MLVRIGIVGIGNMGFVHATQIFHHKVSGLQLTAVCDNNPVKIMSAQKVFGEQIYYFSDYHKMLTSDTIDAVIIATPHVLHPFIAKAAFACKLHVLTEKPAGIDTKSVREMNEAACDSGKIYAIMYNQRTNPLYQKLREYVKSGQLGTIKRFVWIINNWYRTQAYYDSGDWRATWNGEGGGVLLNQCPHNLDIWQWIMGMPFRLRAFCRTAQYHHIQVEDDVTIYAEYENGANACFITSTGEYPGTNRLEISGTLGKAVIEDGKLKLYLLKQDEREICFHSPEAMPQDKIEFIEEEQETQENGHLGILQNFADAILKGVPLIAPGKEGINSLMITNAAYLSEWTNDWTTLPIEEEKFCDFLKEKQEQEKISSSRSEVFHGELHGEYENRWYVQW